MIAYPVGANSFTLDAPARVPDLSDMFYLGAAPSSLVSEQASAPAPVFYFSDNTGEA
jgi:hypothetical protein